MNNQFAKKTVYIIMRPCFIPTKYYKLCLSFIMYLSEFLILFNFFFRNKAYFYLCYALFQWHDRVAFISFHNADIAGVLF